MAAASPGVLPGLSGIMTATDFLINIKQQAVSAGKLFVFISFVCFFFACGNGGTKKIATATQDSTAVYYPINNYIRQQVKDVDTTPYYLYRLQIIDNKKDSSVVSRAVFDAETKQFLLPGLEDKSFRSNFTESVFDDESTNSITLTYTPKDTNNIVQNASILLDKENQMVKWIFINTLSTGGDSTVIQRIGWKGDKSCYINKAITHLNKKETQVQTAFVWNDKEEE